MLIFIAQNLAPLMFVALVFFLLIGYPVAFSLGAIGLLFFGIAVHLAPYSEGAVNLSWTLLNSMPGRIYEVMRNDTLLAIPFFTFMGLILERSGMAEDLLETIGQLFGSVRGGLAYAVIIVGTLLAATTGVVAASVISMGLISLPIMLRYGYDRRLASGTIAASGTLAQIIPPSLVLIVLADQLGRSVDDMYKGALLPGLLLAGSYALYVFFITLIKPSFAPGLSQQQMLETGHEGSRGIYSVLILILLSGCFGTFSLWQSTYTGIDFLILSITTGVMFAFSIALVNKSISKITGLGFLSPLAERVTFVMTPPLILIFIVLGTILVGIATPVEGGAMGAVGALLLASCKRTLKKDPKYLNFEVIRQATEATAKLSSFVMFILIGARIFSLTFYGVNGHVWVEHLLTSLPGGMYGFIVATMILVFFLAFFLDFFELAFILVPLLKPAAETVFRKSPEAISLAKSFSFPVTNFVEPNGNVIEIIPDVSPFIIWYGILLAINMQTSFMHPPFGFALFYLRSVAPKEAYTDKITGKKIDPIKTSEIYLGALPYLLIQILMIGLVITMPWLALHAQSQLSAQNQNPSVVEKTLNIAPKDKDANENLSSPPKKKFSLPPTPPQIGGGMHRPYNGPDAPTLDVKELPKFD
ncbi:MAG: TRAP transporter large permease subunit [Hyphomicrobium sp.]